MYGKSTKTVYRYLNMYDKNGIDGLKCLYSQRGRKKIFKGEIGTIISKHIKYECHCCNYSSTLIDQHLKIKEECLKRRIVDPSFSTVYRMKIETYRSST